MGIHIITHFIFKINYVIKPGHSVFFLTNTTTVPWPFPHNVITDSHTTMSLLYLATCSGCSLCRVCLSAARSQSAGGARPVSDSLMPVKAKRKKKNTNTSSQDIWSHWFNEKIWVRPINLTLKPIYGFVTHLWARWSFWAAAGCHLPLVWSVWSRCFDPDDEQHAPH